MTPTYKLFTNVDEQFNLVNRSHANKRAICEVMYSRKDLDANNRGHYASIAGLEPVEKGDIRYYEFDERYDRHNWYWAIVDKLFMDCPALMVLNGKNKPIFASNKIEIGGVTLSARQWCEEHLDEEAVMSALGFFLSRSGETVHGQADWLFLSKMFRQLNPTNTPQPSDDGKTV